MNRADRMLAALMDGRPHTRQDIQSRKGYFLTNNAASELRKRGHIVNHWREGRVDYYQLADARVQIPHVPAPRTSTGTEAGGGSRPPSGHTSPLAQSEGADNRRPTSTGDSLVTSSTSTGPSSDYASGVSLSPVGGPPSSADEQAPLTLQLTLEAA